ncbi:FMN-dependent NADH-azoreductase [Streptomyces spirodelae]|uniref:FMN dependent NADH:quinone oxidoreductase n=1 Tax=Streptomyces spirodelae TaxID=2812904 RepID=A0ABS3WT41_9ACTN|nr:NAD(P)H-dependent oxidoreductase [Streptomyces spirodelae]MBO8186036.1 NAD(P)H-dependent oxidoreductase [Streptomyces spirodelae]
MEHDATTPALLHIDASVSPADTSVSRQLTSLFAGKWRQRYGDAGYHHRDLAAEPVPLVDAGYVRFGYWVERHGTVPVDEVSALVRDAADEAAWRATRPLVEEVLAADVLLLGVPMYNLTVPAALMAWIDRISFPGALLDPAAGRSRLRDKQIVVVGARGGGYGPGAPREGLDFQVPYLRGYFTDRGVPEGRLHFVTAELTRARDVPAMAPLRSRAAASLDAAREGVIELVDRLAAPPGARGTARQATAEPQTADCGQGRPVGSYAV